MLQGNSASPVDGVGRHMQPAGVVEGLRQASVGLRSGFTSAAQAVILRPARSLQQEGLASAIGTPPSRPHIIPPVSHRCHVLSRYVLVSLQRGRGNGGITVVSDVIQRIL